MKGLLLLLDLLDLAGVEGGYKGFWHMACGLGVEGFLLELMDLTKGSRGKEKGFYKLGLSSVLFILVDFFRLKGPVYPLPEYCLYYSETPPSNSSIELDPVNQINQEEKST